MKRTVPGFALLDFGVPAADPRTGQSGQADQSVPTDPADHANHRVADRLCTLLAARLDRPVTDDFRRACLVAVEAADALLRLAFRTDPAGDPALVAETRVLLQAYLARTLD